MRIATGTVGYLGYSDPSKNGMLLALYRRILDRSSLYRVDLVCLPGGYLQVKDDTQKDELAAILVAEAKKRNIAVAVGIDLSAKRQPPWDHNYENILIRHYSLPLFAICWTPKQDNVSNCWRERSTRHDNASLVPAHALSEERRLPVQDGWVEILMCGEIFNQSIRSNIVRHKENLNAAIVLGHESRGFRVWNGMKILSKQGLITLCSVHTERKGGMKFRYDPGGVCRSTQDADIVLNADLPAKLSRTEPRVELKIWDV